jgi:hypothetical protein
LLNFFFVPGLALGGAEQEEDEGVDDQYGRAQQESDPPLTQSLLECDGNDCIIIILFLQNHKTHRIFLFFYLGFRQ